MNFDAATHMNNLGVVALAEDDFRGALDKFNSALLYLSTGSLEPSHSSETMPTLPTLSPADRSTRYAFFHSAGIKLVPLPSFYSPQTVASTLIASSIILFNVSTLYHLKALSGSQGSTSTLLNKAKTLYQFTHILLVTAGIPLVAIGQPVIDILSMASYNNLAHVSFELCGYEESRSYFGHLIRFALTAVPITYGGSTFVVAVHISRFLVNATILQEPTRAPAA
jgi:hypothetical protein